jgi:hypothetical protein
MDFPGVQKAFSRLVREVTNLARKGYILPYLGYCLRVLVHPTEGGVSETSCCGNGTQFSLSSRPMGKL